MLEIITNSRLPILVGRIRPLFTPILGNACSRNHNGIILATFINAEDIYFFSIYIKMIYWISIYLGIKT